MIKEIYANAEVTENNEADSRDSRNSYEDVFVNQDKLETQRPRNFRKSESSGGDTAWSRCYRLTAVCVVLLCVLLLSAVTVLWINYNILYAKINLLQTSSNNLTIERDQLQTSYNNLTIERDQLQTSYNNLTIERDQLQTSYNNLTIERDQLQTSYNNLTIERDQLQTSYNNLTIERDQLQTSNNNLTIERDQLQIRYSILTIERDEVQKERDEFLRKFCVLNKASCFNSKLHFMSTEKKNWTESRQDCMNKGSDLVIINSREEQDFITDKLQGSRAWIGLSDRDTEGEWKWVDGTPLTSGKWGPGQPDNYQDEDCGETGYPDGQHWNDAPCSHKLGWICEKRT